MSVESFGQLQDGEIRDLQSEFGNTIDSSQAGMVLMTRFGLGFSKFPSGGKRQRTVRKRRQKLLDDDFFSTNTGLKNVVQKVFEASDPAIRGGRPNDEEVKLFHDLFAREARKQLRKKNV